MKITKSDFGTLNTGENIYIYHMENANGAYVEVINFGCRLVKIVVPDRDGKMTDVCLGFDSMEDYARDNASCRPCCQSYQGRSFLSGWQGIPACHQQRLQPSARRTDRLRFQALGRKDQG